MKRTPLKRRTPLRAKTGLKAKSGLKRSTKPLRAKPKSAEEKAAIEQCRKDLFARSGGYCERRTSKQCRGWVPLEGDVFTRGHAAHRIRKNKLPKSEQWNPKHLDWSCYECHIIEEHSKGNKPALGLDVAAVGDESCGVPAHNRVAGEEGL